MKKKEDKSKAKLPCPFCKNINLSILQNKVYYFYVYCGNCGTSGPAAPTKIKATNRWNKALRPIELRDMGASETKTKAITPITIYFVTGIEGCRGTMAFTNYEKAVEARKRLQPTIDGTSAIINTIKVDDPETLAALDEAISLYERGTSIFKATTTISDNPRIHCIDEIYDARMLIKTKEEPNFCFMSDKVYSVSFWFIGPRNDTEEVKKKADRLFKAMLKDVGKYRFDYFKKNVEDKIKGFMSDNPEAKDYFDVAWKNYPPEA